jgi:hypothetical protein
LTGPDPDSSDHQSDRARDSQTLSPRATSKPPLSSASLASKFEDSIGGIRPSDNSLGGLPLFGTPDTSGPFNYQLPLPFNLPVSPGNSFPDFGQGSSLDSSIFKPESSTSYGNMFGMFDAPDDNTQHHHHNSHHAMEPPRRSPPTPPISSTPAQPDLLARLKQCCHLSDSHVVNDPGLLIFATRLCQSYPCSFSGAHPETIGLSDSEHLMLEDSWKALKAQLDPAGAEADGENRINTGRMAAELVCRAAQSRGGGFIVCRYREGMSIKRSMIKQLVAGLGGHID